ncbi:alkaline phosphatase [Leptolyngbya sp. DQ-M1]|uniref:alkaline phosphatase n=1 Tax=Leptolyngbya sp. DQ-M1 TaxID=2933920 RepID=UPI0032981E4E
MTTGNHVIFIHPDGASPSHFAATRFIDKGPDGRLNWDNLDRAGVYLGHMEDQLGGTSNAGAVTHATGAKTYAESFGLDADGSPVESLSGNTGRTIVQEAIAANKVTALVQSGAAYEPGTAAFVAQVGEITVNGQRIPPRQRLADITKEVILSGADFILGGGELNMIPVGQSGFHGTAAEYDALSTNALQRPSENLIELAKSLGYTVVYTEEQLNELLDSTKYPTPPTKVLGVFAPVHTFNDRPEEVLAQRGQPLYVETAPTVGEMLDVTQKLMEQHPNFNNGSIAIVEEEGSDNFGNNNNAAGTIEGVRRADAAIGIALNFVNKYSNTLLLTAADSDAGGLQTTDRDDPAAPVGTVNANLTTSTRPVPLDGQTGANTTPFVAAPDASGDAFPFAVGWVGTPDFSGSIVSKAHGLNAEKLPATVDNTGMYELMYETLFNTELPTRVTPPTPAPAATKDTGNVIFIHPDGTSPSHYMAVRNIDKGPDGRLNWDMMSNAGVYLGHMENQLTGTSNAGAVTHANGVKVFDESFGLEEDNTEIVPLSGKAGKTILEEAIDAGKATALIQSGHLAEPGSAAFAAETTNRLGDDIRSRDKFSEIIEQVIRSGTDVILGGGELYMLPKGTTGFHVTAELDASESRPERRPSTNLIELAQSLGYTVVYTEEQMNAAVNGSTPPEKLLGVFSAIHTFDDRTEEALGLNTANPKPLYVETAPTVAEMLDASLKIIQRDPDGFFAVVEEEGSDNFANNNNAVGTVEAVRRADAAIGVAMNYVNTQDPNTLVITAADSDAGGLQVSQFKPYTRPTGSAITTPELLDSETEVPFINVNPTTTNTTRNFLDGVNGSTASADAPWKPFASMDSLDGPMGNFGVGWVGTPDFPGSIVSKAYGMNADLLPSTLDNTEIYRLMYQTMFGVRFSEVLKAEGGQKTAEVTTGEGYLAVVNFGGVGVDPSESTIAEADTIQFRGADLTARNLLLTEQGDDLVISFEGVANTGVILRNFHSENLNNLSQATGASIDLGKLIFDGQSSVEDSFDVFRADADLAQILNRNSVTFFNDLDNTVSGFDGSNDVMNAQGGDDRSFGLSGDDLLRGGAGFDYLDGGLGSDILVGGTEADVFALATGNGSDTIQDFNISEGDKIALSGGLTFGRLSLLQGTGANANNTLIQAGTSNELLATLVGVQASSLTQSSFMLIA